MQLVSDWKSAWKFYSTRAMSLALIAQSVWLGLPAEMRESIPPKWMALATIAMLVLGILGRFIKQSPTDHDGLG